MRTRQLSFGCLVTTKKKERQRNMAKVNSPLVDIIKVKLLSRKFWAAVAAATLVAFSNNLGVDITDAQLWAFVGIVSSYIFGEGALDAIRTLNA